MTAARTAMGGLDVHYENARINPQGLKDEFFRFKPPPGAMRLPSLPGF